MTSNNTRPDAVRVDVIGDKDGSNRVRNLGTASILGILPEGHPWTLAGSNRESECCGTFHVDVEGQTTHIRCVTSGHTILSGRGLAKTLQMMADMGNAPVVVSHDPGASSTIKNAEYAPSGEFAPVAPVAEVAEVAEDIPTNAEVDALMAEHGAAMAAWVAPVVEAVSNPAPPILTGPTRDGEPGTPVRPARVEIQDEDGAVIASTDTIGARVSEAFAEEVWTGAGVVVTSHGKTLWTETRDGVTRVKGSKGGYTLWDGAQFAELMDLGVLTVPPVTVGRPILTNLNRRKRKATKVSARRVRGGF